MIVVVSRSRRQTQRVEASHRRSLVQAGSEAIAMGAGERGEGPCAAAGEWWTVRQRGERGHRARREGKGEGGGERGKGQDGRGPKEKETERGRQSDEARGGREGREEADQGERRTRGEPAGT